MTYATIAQMAGDNDLLQRAAACAAREGIADPWGWAARHARQLAASPGWEDAYASALAAKTDRPGWSDAVVTDQVILTAVQLITTRERNAADAAEREATIPIVA